MSIKPKHIVLTFYTLFIVSRLLASIAGFSSDIVRWMPYIYCVVVGMYTVLQFRPYMRLTAKNGKLLRIQLLVLGHTLVFGYFMNSAGDALVQNQFVSMLVFLISVMLTAYFAYREACLPAMLYITYICISLFLATQYLLYFDGIKPFVNMPNLFSQYDRYRNAYGLSHANVTGNLCFLALILSGYLHNITQKRRGSYAGIFNIISNTIIVVMLISTGSRSAVTALLLFYVLFAFFNLDSFIKASKIRLFAIKAIMILAVLLVAVMTVSVELDDLFVQTNREGNFLINIPIMFRLGMQLTGMGFVDAGVFYKDFNIMYGTSFVDNYYLYVFLTTGIVGFAILMLALLLLYRLLLRTDNTMGSGRKKFISALYIAHLYYGLFETCVIYPQFLSSFIFLMMYFAVATGKGGLPNKASEENSPNG